MTKVDIVCPDNGYGGVATSSRLLNKAFIDQGVDSNIIFIKTNGRVNLLHFFKSIFFLDKMSYVILMHFESILLGFFIGFFRSNRVVNVFHTDLVDYYKSVGFFKKMIVWLLVVLIRNKPVVFVSKESNDKARLFFRLKRSSFIYNVFDMCCKSSFSGFDKEEVIFGVVSRLDSLKNIDLVIRVVHAVKSAGYPVRLLIYGAGDEMQALQHYVEELGANSYITFKGYCSDKNVIYKSIDGLISLSSLEGFGLVILESISYFRPVFHTDCSAGPRELMSPNTNPLIKTQGYEKTTVGYLVKPVQVRRVYAMELNDNERIYVDYLVSFLSDIKNSKFSMDFDSDVFSAQRVVSNWLSFFKLNF